LSYGPGWGCRIILPPTVGLNALCLGHVLCASVHPTTSVFLNFFRQHDRFGPAEPSYTVSFPIFPPFDSVKKTDPPTKAVCTGPACAVGIANCVTCPCVSICPILFDENSAK